MILVGGPGVGKTSLVSRVARGGKFDENEAPTLGVVGSPKILLLERSNITFDLNIYVRAFPAFENRRLRLQQDAAGQGRFRSLVPLYYFNVHLALVVFDVTSRASFAEVLRCSLHSFRRFWRDFACSRLLAIQAKLRFSELCASLSPLAIVALVGNKGTLRDTAG